MIMIKVCVLVVFLGLAYGVSDRSMRNSMGVFIDKNLGGALSMAYQRPWVEGVEVLKKKGKVFRVEGETYYPLKRDIFNKNVFFQTGESSTLLLRFGHNSLVKLFPHSQLKIKTKPDGIVLYLPFGSLFTSLSYEEKRSVAVETPYGSFRGEMTDLLIKTQKQGRTSLAVLAGKAVVEVNRNGNLYYVNAGEGTGINELGRTLTPKKYQWVQEIKWNKVVHPFYIDDFKEKLEDLKWGPKGRLSRFEKKAFPFVQELSRRVANTKGSLQEYMSDRQKTYFQQGEKGEWVEKKEGTMKKTKKLMKGHYDRLEKAYSE